MFIVIIFTCCFILVYILLYVPPCTQAFPNLIARTFVVAGLSVSSVCNFPRVYLVVSVGFSGSYPGGVSFVIIKMQIHIVSSNFYAV
jgi:hypothetical protein